MTRGCNTPCLLAYTKARNKLVVAISGQMVGALSTPLYMHTYPKGMTGPTHILHLKRSVVVQLLLRGAFCGLVQHMKGSGMRCRQIAFSVYMSSSWHTPLWLLSNSTSSTHLSYLLTGRVALPISPKLIKPESRL